MKGQRNHILWDCPINRVLEGVLEHSIQLE